MLAGPAALGLISLPCGQAAAGGGGGLGEASLSLQSRAPSLQLLFREDVCGPRGTPAAPHLGWGVELGNRSLLVWLLVGQPQPARSSLVGHGSSLGICEMGSNQLH